MGVVVRTGIDCGVLSLPLSPQCLLGAIDYRRSGICSESTRVDHPRIESRGLLSTVACTEYIQALPSPVLYLPPRPSSDGRMSKDKP